MYEFLSDEWFAKVDELVAAAGDLKIPAAMRAACINVTVRSGDRAIPVLLKDGLFRPGHEPGAPTALTLDEPLARKIFLEADAAAGVQAFLEGKMEVTGDLATLVAMQTVDPSEPQKQLTRKIAAITLA